MVKIDKEKCIGCGVCANICPAGFIVENAVAEIIDENADCIEDATTACPVEAIITDNKIINQSKAKEEIIPESKERTGDSYSSYGKGGGQGRYQGSGSGGGGGRGRNQGSGRGQGGSCVCPSCGYKEPHQRGVPCYETRCPKCNSVLKRY